MRPASSVTGSATRGEIIVAAGIASTYVWGHVAGWITVALLSGLGGWGLIRHGLLDLRATRRIKREMKGH